MEVSELKRIVEGALLAAGRPLKINELANLFDENGRPENAVLREALTELGEECEDRAYELQEVGSGFRFQVRSKYGLWVSRLWEEKQPRYSRALLETLALVAYKQPLTRGEIEDVRGVAVSTNIMRTLLERGWVRVVGHRDVPGKPAMYATTREFLDYFNLKTLSQLPSLADIKEIAQINPELALEAGEEEKTEGRSIEMPIELEEDAADEDKELSSEEVEAIVSGAAAVASGEEILEQDSAEAESGTDEDTELSQESAVAESETEAEAEAENETATEQNELEESVPTLEDVDPDADFNSLPN